MYRSSVILWSLIGVAVVLVFWLPSVVSLIFSSENISKDSWFVRLTFNLFGYATIVLPGYLILLYVKKNNDPTASKFLPNIIKLCFLGKEADKVKVLEENAGSTPCSQASAERTTRQEAIVLFICIGGLQGSYLLWGVLQEKIMTKDYVAVDGSSDRFTDSQFLVFVNRILAFVLSGCYVAMTTQPRHTVALYKYSYCSFSNVMSSWCQYEALKYVSFPTQVLTKASKIIPVMIMGKVVSKKSYEYYEYVTAVAMSLGMAMFLIGSADDVRKTTVTTFSGVILLFGYMVFDSFTSNWQSELYTQHKMSSVQMMCGVNLFSCLFTGVSLIQQGGFVLSFRFMLTYPSFVLDTIVLSLCSAAGQLFLFYTIAQFGPVVFAIIMTIRQCLAILLSCIIYGHPVNALGIVGIVVVFLAIFVRTYCSQRLRTLRKQRILDATNRV